MGVVYNLSVNNFQQSRKEVVNITLENVKEYLQSFDYKDRVRLLCLDDCKSCEVLVEGIKVASLDDFLDESVNVYRYEYLSGVQEVMKSVHFNKEDIQEDVCFSYSIDRKGVGEQVLVEYKDSVYDLSTYISPTTKYASIEEAVDSKQKLIEEVIQ